MPYLAQQLFQKSEWRSRTAASLRQVNHLWVITDGIFLEVHLSPPPVETITSLVHTEEDVARTIQALEMVAPGVLG